MRDPDRATSSRRELVRYGLRFAVFALPFLIAWIAELAAAPNAFTFRMWEALVTTNRSLFSGPYYPDIDISGTEVGDLAPHTPLAVEKQVRWVTDEHGFRSSPERTGPFPIVVVGHSLVVGTSLSQNDTLAEVLEHRIGKPVYPYAPASLEAFLDDPRFRAAPPHVVVLVCFERALDADVFVVPSAPGPPAAEGLLHALPVPVRIAIDRTGKQAARHAVQSLLQRWITPSTPRAAAGGMVFLEGLSPPAERTTDGIREAAVACRDALAKRGITLVVMPVPNKSTIYHDRLKMPAAPRFLPEVYAELAAARIAVVDLQTPFLAARDKELLYHLDDTHWSPAGVRLAVDELRRHLK